MCLAGCRLCNCLWISTVGTGTSWRVQYEGKTENRRESDVIVREDSPNTVFLQLWAVSISLPRVARIICGLLMDFTCVYVTFY